MKVAVLGSQGFLGSEICNRFKADYDVIGITRLNYNSLLGNQFDILINANGNSKRYWANDNILKDFEASTISVYKTFFDFKASFYIYISSADVYPEHAEESKTAEEAEIDTSNLCPYGFHKYLSELLVKKYSGKYLILRCSSLIGENLKKGPFKDILDGNPLFVTRDSKLQFISTSEVAKIILKLAGDNVYNEIFNIGGVGAVSLEYLERLTQKKLFIQQAPEKQIYEMKVDKIKKIFPVKKSEDYIQEFLDLKKGGVNNEGMEQSL